MEARLHILTGIELLAQGEAAAALVHFDRAIALREAAAWRENPQAAWELAAAWLNRGDALRQLGRDAVAGYDRAIEAMAHVPLAENPAFPDRLALAWINRATAGGGLADFSRAEEILDQWCEPPSARRRMLRSMLHANRARCLSAAGEAAAAWADARAAVALCDISPETALAAVGARAILCRALADLLELPGGPALEDDWIAAATDAAEEALEIARTHGVRGRCVAELIRYAARIYRSCQPHFLGAFVVDSRWLLDGADPALLAELARARRDVQRRISGRSHDTPWVRRAVQTLISLQEAEALVTAAGRDFDLSGRPLSLTSATSP